MADPKKALEAMNSALEALSPLDSDERERALKWLGETLNVDVPTSDQKEEPKHRPARDGKESPKQFLAKKRPEADVERIACLAFYLTHKRDTPKFKTRELTDLNTEAAGQRFNASRAANNALNQNGYLAQAGKGQRQISVLGEQVVEAMPDRDAVAKAIAGAPKRRRKKSGKGRAKNKPNNS